jgi:hypothetical protein
LIFRKDYAYLSMAVVSIFVILSLFTFLSPITTLAQQQQQLGQRQLNTTKSQPSQPQLPQLRLLGMNSFYDNNPYLPQLHIVGEVLNNGTQPATAVSVSATLYDTNKQVVGVGHADATPSDIMPGKKAPFEILVSRDSVKGGDFRNVSNITLQPG